MKAESGTNGFARKKILSSQKSQGSGELSQLTESQIGRAKT